MAINSIPINKFSGSQHVLAADRVILNSVLDDIYIISSKNIVIGSLGEIHVNAKGDVYINTFQDKKIIFGNPNTRNGVQPALMGNKTTELIQKLLSIISLLQVDTPAGPGIASQSVLESINQLKQTYLNSTSPNYILSDFVMVSNNLKK